MKIVNAMFSRGLGGIEQAFIDYTESLALRGHEVICVTRPKAKINAEVAKLQAQYPEKIVLHKIKAAGNWDILAKCRLNSLLKKHRPQAVIAHGNRPCALFRTATVKNNIPQIGVVHNYWFKDVLRSDFLICVSSDISTKIIAQWVGSERVHKVPNLIRMQPSPQIKPRSNPPVIGIIARMVQKKGVDVFIKALGILANRGVACRAVIAGDGPLRYQYQTQRDNLQLNDRVRFSGWVHDKNAFYNEIDIFCLPSLSEPFGIVLLEAMSRKKPMVSTNIEGPAEILQPGSDALMVDKGNPTALADALEQLIKDEEKSRTLAEQGYNTANSRYSLPVVAELLEQCVAKMIDKHGKENA